MRKTIKNDPIGVFDTGVGGLTVVKEIINHLPNENVVYFGDTARVPYGSKSKETIIKFSKQIMRFLMEKQVKMIVIACGTVSSNAYDELVAAFNIPIIEMVTHGVNACINSTKTKCIGIIGTEGTIRSKAHERALKEMDAEISVFSNACPLFVPLAEENWTDNEIAEMTAKIYLRPIMEKGIDSLVLGCTHYPLLIKSIQKTVGAEVNVINPAVEAARAIKRFLVKQDLLNNDENTPSHSFYVSDNTNKFNTISKLVLNNEYIAEIVDIEQY